MRESTDNPAEVPPGAPADQDTGRGGEAVGAPGALGILGCMTQVVVPVAAADAAMLTRMAGEARSAGADLIELRLDSCAKLGAQPAAMLGALAALPLPAVVTIRHASEGGDWSGSEAERAGLYLQAAAGGAAYIDVELAHWQGLSGHGLAGRAGGAQLILSYHDFEGMGEDLDGRIREMRRCGAAVAKVAVRASDGADLAIIADLHRDHVHEGPLVAIAMGEHGIASRLLVGAWGGHFAFARLVDDPGSAPGQPTVGELIDLYRVRSQSEHTRIYGVIGSPVAHSLSPVIHNTAFIHHHLDCVYVPFRVENAPAFWRAFGARISGLSITIPHKSSLLTLMHGVEAQAGRIGAINTVYRDKDLHAVGANTDALAVVRCLEGVCANLKDRIVLVLGAGGVSRAIAVAVAERGAKVVIANRTLERAQELAAEIGASAVTFAEAVEIAYDVLVNGTAVGMGKGDESPWPAAAHRKDSLVFDTIYHPLETRLLKDAQLAGARTVGGLDMLISQALGQFSRWTGLEAPEPLMHRAALDRLGRTQWA
jgi:3-dehydroquinate dehydratase / shikimate dehydrogenase